MPASGSSWRAGIDKGPLRHPRVAERRARPPPAGFSQSGGRSACLHAVLLGVQAVLRARQRAVRLGVQARRPHRQPLARPRCLQFFFFFYGGRSKKGAGKPGGEGGGFRVRREAGGRREPATRRCSADTLTPDTLFLPLPPPPLSACTFGKKRPETHSAPRWPSAAGQTKRPVFGYSGRGARDEQGRWVRGWRVLLFPPAALQEGEQQGHWRKQRGAGKKQSKHGPVRASP